MPQGAMKFLNAAASGAVSAKGITTTRQVKTGPGRLTTLIINTPGDSGDLTINDSVGGTGGASRIYSCNFASLVAGQVIELNWPVTRGIYVSGIPTNANISIAYN